MQELVDKGEVEVNARSAINENREVVRWTIEEKNALFWALKTHKKDLDKICLEIPTKTRI